MLIKLENCFDMPCCRTHPYMDGVRGWCNLRRAGPKELGKHSDFKEIPEWCPLSKFKGIEEEDPHYAMFENELHKAHEQIEQLQDIVQCLQKELDNHPSSRVLREIGETLTKYMYFDANNPKDIAAICERHLETKKLLANEIKYHEKSTIDIVFHARNSAEYLEALEDIVDSGDISEAHSVAAKKIESVKKLRKDTL